MFSKIVMLVLHWLPDRSDLPEGLRIGLPMMAGLLLFSAVGDTTSGVNALICAWLVGVQGRNIAYPKRLTLLSLSAVLCCVGAGLSMLSLIQPLLGIAVLMLVGLLYGLCSNQRKYIQLLTYNVGFSLICAMHLLETDTPWLMVLLSTAFGSWSAMLSAVLAGPWLSIQQGEQLLAKVTRQFVNWCAILGYSDAANVGKRLALREQLDDAIAVLAHWLQEMPDNSAVKRIAGGLRSHLQLIEAMEEIGRIRQHEISMANATALQHYLYEFAANFDAFLLQGAPLPHLPLENGLHPALTAVEQQIQQALLPSTPLPANWRTILKLIWPSDADSIKTQWRKALHKGSREWHHGLRILFTLFCCQLVVELLPFQQGYWVTLTAFILLMAAPLGQLQLRIWGRFYGTLLGSLVALALVWYCGTGAWLLPATCLTLFLAFATYYKARYEIHVFWLTVMMVFAITLLLPAEPYIAFYRALDTLTGVVLSVLAMYLFIPSWTRRWLDNYVCHFIELEQQWLQSIANGTPDIALRWQAHAALRQLSLEVSYMKLEPNTSARELQDWQSFLWLGLTLHCTLVVLARQGQQSQLQPFCQQLAAWSTLFRRRLQPQWSLLPPATTVSDEVHQWLLQDIAQLYAWLHWQQPFQLTPKHQ
ncbi:FUSC family protein [Shewanella fodinae]|uniref:Fusaric acid resistance family protein n=1 Tax=Shewanella fodinae TaxID=552357 RepID=A0A4R2F5C1_9GAMM|nr:FUSC family protein [Shewanella fodinae]TCN80959.1 fusaric acid resistance family protein [Shewanella fodinae]